MHAWQDDSVLPNPSIVSDDGGTLEPWIPANA